MTPAASFALHSLMVTRAVYSARALELSSMGGNVGWTLAVLILFNLSRAKKDYIIR